MPNLLGPTPVKYVLLMLFAGICCSWLATALWNMCSAKLPTALVGQLLVFETIFSVLYAHIQRLQWPSTTQTNGYHQIKPGKTDALRIFSKNQAQKNVKTHLNKTPH